MCTPFHGVVALGAMMVIFLSDGPQQVSGTRMTLKVADKATMQGPIEEKKQQKKKKRGSKKRSKSWFAARLPVMWTKDSDFPANELIQKAMILGPEDPPFWTTPWDKLVEAARHKIGIEFGKDENFKGDKENAEELWQHFEERWHKNVLDDSESSSVVDQGLWIQALIGSMKNKIWPGLTAHAIGSIIEQKCLLDFEFTWEDENAQKEFAKLLEVIKVVKKHAKSSGWPVVGDGPNGYPFTVGEIVHLKCDGDTCDRDRQKLSVEGFDKDIDPRSLHIKAVNGEQLQPWIEMKRVVHDKPAADNMLLETIHQCPENVLHLSCDKGVGLMANSALLTTAKSLVIKSSKNLWQLRLGMFKVAVEQQLTKDLALASRTDSTRNRVLPVLPEDWFRTKKAQAMIKDAIASNAKVSAHGKKPRIRRGTIEEWPEYLSYAADEDEPDSTGDPGEDEDEPDSKGDPGAAVPTSMSYLVALVIIVAVGSNPIF